MASADTANSSEMPLAVIVSVGIDNRDIQHSRLALVDQYKGVSVRVGICMYLSASES